MTPDSMQGASDYYVVPGRTLRGSKTEMLAEIDEVFKRSWRCAW